MDWIEEYRQNINTIIGRFFREHYQGEVTQNVKTFQESVLYTVDYGEPSRIHPILAMVAYEEMLGLMAPDSAVSVLIGVEFTHLGLALHTDAVGITGKVRPDDMTPLKKYGAPMAILAGDALMELGVDCLTRSGKMNIIQELMQATGDIGVVRGLSRDILTDHSNISESEYITMYDEELSRLVDASLVIGAMVAGDTQQVFIDQIRQFGTFLTRLYQVKNDISEYENGKSMTDPSFSRRRGVVDFLGYEKSKGLVATIEFELLKMTNNFQSPKFKDLVTFFSNEHI